MAVLSGTEFAGSIVSNDAATSEEGASGPAPLYLKIKRMIMQKIANGLWSCEDKIPSENQLVRELGVSRMTVNRALNELTREGVLMRIQGVGTFVAPSKPESSLLEIRNIADDIRSRGHEHHCRMVLAEQQKASAFLAATLAVRPNAPVFHTLCIHCENGVPVQLEDRHVSPALVPHYLQQDYGQVTPTQYLNTLIPSPSVRHVIDAVVADDATARQLEIQPGEACLRMTRTTWFNGRVVTHVRLTHPGSRYQLAGSFKPD